MTYGLISTDDTGFTGLKIWGYAIQCMLTVEAAAFVQRCQIEATSWFDCLTVLPI